jgi:hypothetical protein
MTTLYDEPTLLRTIARWSFIPNGATIANNSYFMQFGLIALDFEAPGGQLPAGAIPYVPLPYYDGDSDWIYTWHVTVPTATQSIFQSFFASVNGLGEMDLKTRRRFPNGHGLAVVAMYESSTGAGSAYFSTSGRLLFANR